MTITKVKLNQRKDQKNPEKTKRIEEDIQANINFICWKNLDLEPKLSIKIPNLSGSFFRA